MHKSLSAFAFYNGGYYVPKNEAKVRQVEDLIGSVPRSLPAKGPVACIHVRRTGAWG